MMDSLVSAQGRKRSQCGYVGTRFDRMPLIICQGPGCHTCHATVYCLTTVYSPIIAYISMMTQTESKLKHYTAKAIDTFV